MVSLKKISIVAATAAVAAVMAVSLSGCGEDVAATWAHGKIMEEDITTAATNSMSSYVNEDGTTDVDAWTKYIEERQYKTEDEDDAEEATDSKSSDTKSADKTDEETSEKGTVAEYREYLIDQKLRSEIVKYQIKEQKIEVSEDEIDEEVDYEASLYEAYYGGGMSGTFESILETYFGMTMEEFRTNVGEYLAEQKLQEATVGSADSEAEEGDSAEATETEETTESSDSKSTEEEVDYDKLFEEYMDGQVENANLKVNACPSELSYDPAVVAKAAEEAAASTESTESTDDAESTEATDGADNSEATEDGKDESESDAKKD